MQHTNDTSLTPAGPTHVHAAANIYMQEVHSQPDRIRLSHLRRDSDARDIAAAFQRLLGMDAVAKCTILPPAPGALLHLFLPVCCQSACYDGLLTDHAPVSIHAFPWLWHT